MGEPVQVEGASIVDGAAGADAESGSGGQAVIGGEFEQAVHDLDGRVISAATKFDGTLANDDRDSIGRGDCPHHAEHGGGAFGGREMPAAADFLEDFHRAIHDGGGDGGVVAGEAGDGGNGGRCVGIEDKTVGCGEHHIGAELDAGNTGGRPVALHDDFAGTEGVVVVGDDNGPLHRGAAAVGIVAGNSDGAVGAGVVVAQLQRGGTTGLTDGSREGAGGTMGGQAGVTGEGDQSANRASGQADRPEVTGRLGEAYPGEREGVGEEAGHGQEGLATITHRHRSSAEAGGGTGIDPAAVDRGAAVVGVGSVQCESAGSPQLGEAEG